ncbi:unnamed protein product [Rotaria sp. Silwood1]|nr:unnamed protein product [Rotaria sp. Silwood1]CAF1656164.1 unnamed protein product [Rotaria sp. Silwood1]CAF3947967.1 unnamed protein product [Rotaria sp. Silwood1]CAF4048526.1 unnamed protein product [Rotaria sp. Silwood1]CAF5016195.1 unnamed protein product [Rotaria sp. Silwood1]
MEEMQSLPKPQTSDATLPSVPYSNSLLKLQAHLNSKTCSCCFNLHPLTTARIVNERAMSGYVANLWTLGESRWTSEVSAPFYGDEPIPNNPVGDIWHNYSFERPNQTMLDNTQSRQLVRDLKETQRRE